MAWLVVYQVNPYCWFVFCQHPTRECGRSSAAPGATWRCLSAEHSSGAENLGSKASYPVVSFLKPAIWKSGTYNITCGKDKVYASVLQKKCLRDGKARAPCRALSTTRHRTPFQVPQPFKRQIKIPHCIATEWKTKKKRERLKSFAHSQASLKKSSKELSKDWPQLKFRPHQPWLHAFNTNEDKR